MPFLYFDFLFGLYFAALGRFLLVDEQLVMIFWPLSRFYVAFYLLRRHSWAFPFSFINGWDLSSVVCLCMVCRLLVKMHYKF